MSPNVLLLPRAAGDPVEALQGRPEVNQPVSLAVKPLLLTPRAAAAALAVSERSLWALTYPRGPIPVVRLGRAVRYDVRDLAAFIDRAKQGVEQ
jgi:hypothetical protein